MAYSLVYYGNETLKKVSEEVKNIDDELLDLIDSMFEIMYKAKGIGLAAPQVDVSKKVVVIDIKEFNGKPPLVLINPVINESSDETEPYNEGCLSVPGINEDIIRPSKVLVKAIDVSGKKIEIETGGLLARVMQHEIDHTNGIVFIDHLEEFIRRELRPELKKIKKMNAVKKI
jgi:peptide deformylase